MSSKVGADRRFEPFCERCCRIAKPGDLGCECGGSIFFRYDYLNVRWDESRRDMWKFRHLLPIDASAFIHGLGEGGTPLIASRSLTNVWFKDETRNPTGSHKDRSLAVAVNHAKQIGASVSAVVSSGSTGISNAALSSRAGISSIAFAPVGTPTERLFPAMELGSIVYRVDDLVDVAISKLRLLQRENSTLYNSTTARSSNPYQAEGAKTIAYEIAESFVPDWVVVPLGGGGTAAAIRRGFVDLELMGRIDKQPRILGAVSTQYPAIAERVSPEHSTVAQGSARESRVSILVKISHADPPDVDEVVKAIQQSRGHVVRVDDDAAIAAQSELGRSDGLFIEPSSASALVALSEARRQEIVKPTETVVVVLTGSGFREAFLTLGRRPPRIESTSARCMESVLVDVLKARL